MSNSKLADMRKSYQQAELLEAQALAEPLKQFELWLSQALEAEVPEANAMTLATVSSQLRPSTRVVLIKGCDERGLVWFTNYDSRKGQELAGNPFAALQFHWVELERVVRIEGHVEKVSDEESDTYFHSRPLDSRPMADQRGGIRGQVHAAAAASTALGRLPAGPRQVGVLARRCGAVARPAGVPLRGRPLGERTFGALKLQAFNHWL
jgi:pyridoxamine 5'-phosphate oxidase